MKIKDKDFIKIEYIGRIKELNIVFDTTNEEIAKKEKIYNEKMEYGPVTVCIGEKHLLPGLDKKIIGKETGKEYDFELSPEEGFGKKSAQLLKLVPARVFKQQQIVPMPGLEINVDGMPGILRRVSGGRIIVDFNHPLAGKVLEYELEILKKITELKEKIKSVFYYFTGLEEVEVIIKNEEAEINIKKKVNILVEAKERIAKTIIKWIKGIKKVKFIEEFE